MFNSFFEAIKNPDFTPGNLFDTSKNWKKSKTVHVVSKIYY